MSQDRLDQTLADAIAAGLLPGTARRPEQDTRPWPVVLLTALGAWLAAVPLLIVVGALMGDVALRGAGTYVIAAMALGVAVMLLRSRTLPLFVEQLAVPALIVGGSLLGYALFRDLSQRWAALAASGAVAAVVAAVPKPWLRVLLGAAVAALVGLAVAPPRWNYFSGRSEWPAVWLALHVLLAIALVGAWVQRDLLNRGEDARVAAAWESVSVGWLLVTLAGLAFWASMTFLVGASLGGGGAVGEIARELSPKLSSMWGDMVTLRLASLALAGAGAAWLAFNWPALRQGWCAGVALVLLGLAWFMPSLGGVLLVLAYCIAGGRWRVAGAAGVAAAWIIGAFYYQLSWPLADKALLLAGCGAALGALAWVAARGARSTSDTRNAMPYAPAWGKSQAGLAGGALLVLAVANIGIWQKENLIAHGQPVFVALAPVDPRSLMQGDYMALRFAIPSVTDGQASGANSGRRPHMVARRDARGIAALQRLDTGGEPLAADELRIELSPKNGGWVLVTDAWFFKEGEADRWAQAKYGEFRVDATGRALLVGLRGAELQKL